MRTGRTLLCLFVGLFVLAFVAPGARAQGVIVPGPCRRCPTPPRPVTLPRALPVKSINIDTKINGQVATTHHDYIKPYTEEFPKVHWVSGRRFVEGRKIATSAGVTAGIDLALRVVERYFGREKAVAVTKVIEYQGTGWMV